MYWRHPFVIVDPYKCVATPQLLYSFKPDPTQLTLYVSHGHRYDYSGKIIQDIELKQGDSNVIFA